MIEKINSYWKSSDFFPYGIDDDALIILWNDMTDWWWNRISINSYDLVTQSFPDISYEEYKKIDEAIKFLMSAITDDNNQIRTRFRNYIEEDIYWFEIYLS